jgi:hypothetical protein
VHDVVTTPVTKKSKSLQVSDVEADRKQCVFARLE